MGKHRSGTRGPGRGPRVRRPARHCSVVSAPSLSGGGREEGPHGGGCRTSETLPAAKPCTPSKDAAKLCGCPRPSQRSRWGQVGSGVAAEELGLRLVPSLWLPVFATLHLVKDWKLSLRHLVMSWGLDTGPPEPSPQDGRPGPCMKRDQESLGLDFRLSSEWPEGPYR